MAIQREYYIEDFDEYADERFPEEYTALRTCHTWVMEYKTIRDGANKLRRVPMLLVGRPFFHHGIQNAWAWATGTTIEYYHAHRHEEIVSTLAGLFMNKVYYGVPLIYAAGHQDTSHGMTKSRRTVKALAELVINFMFLLEGQIEFVPNPGNADLLSDFEYACRMFVMRRDEDINNMNNVYMPYYATSDDQAGARSFGSPISGGSSTTHTFSRIKKEPRDDGATPTLVSGSPYRATNSSSSGRAASTKSYGTSASYEPFVPVKKEHDEGNAPSIHWSGSSHTSTSSRTPSTSYHGMFAPHASTIRSSGATPSNPFRLSMSSGPGTTSSSIPNRSSSAVNRTPSSQQSRTSGFHTPSVRPTKQAEGTYSASQAREDRIRALEERLAQKKRRREDDEQDVSYKKSCFEGSPSAMSMIERLTKLKRT